MWLVGVQEELLGHEVSLNEGDGGQPIPNCQSDPLGDAEETSYHLEAGMISPWALYNWTTHCHVIPQFFFLQFCEVGGWVIIHKTTLEKFRIPAVFWQHAGSHSLICSNPLNVAILFLKCDNFEPLFPKRSFVGFRLHFFIAKWQKIGEWKNKSAINNLS